ncbi:phosphoglycerate mutase [Trichophyton equinum CBS 127.97]|uniref:Phosphoglycerate mutase n=1 Tax=Trichophyton equinum (strain ATCC MYA-4606 / CBS 127.97) TaxID=559882 RepID=F2Q4V7_TRIEC|nr:phosphoglycerate mutase [Trichophyton equinum CBS 127.97]
MGRALTGNMPEDSSTDDFKVYTAGMSTFKRRALGSRSRDESSTAPGRVVPSWRGGNGVRGGWDCVVNGECRYLSNGAERGWHFHGEEDFNSMPSSGVVEDSGSRDDIPRVATKL